MDIKDVDAEALADDIRRMLKGLTPYNKWSVDIQIAIHNLAGVASGKTPDVLTSMDDARRCFEAFQEALQPVLQNETVHWEGFAPVVQEAWMRAAHAARTPGPVKAPEGQAKLPGFIPACSMCRGAGTVPVAGNPNDRRVCPLCEGSGELG